VATGKKTLVLDYRRLGGRVGGMREKSLRIAKILSILGFLSLLCSTYLLRSEVLKLNEIRFSSESIKSDESLKEMKASYPVRIQEFKVRAENYELQVEHYEEMLELYRTDYDEYVKRLKDKYDPPGLPTKPHKPQTPELSDKLAQTNLDFRKQQHEYFKKTRQLNWASCISALLLIGGLLFLLMFETGKARLVYLAVVALSFVFMIGPSFHSIMSVIVGFLRAPSPY
jgi:hypothetical protein